MVVVATFMCLWKTPLMIWIFLFVFLFLCKKGPIFLTSFMFLDLLSLGMSILIPFIMFVVYFGSNNFVEDFKFSESLFLFFFISVSVFFTFISSDPFFFLIMFEMSVFPMTYALMVLSKGLDKIESSFFMLFLNLVGSIPFMVFIGAHLQSNNFNFSMVLHFYLDFFVMFGFSFLLLMKFPIFLGHIWLTKAHVSGSGICSMVLASIMLKLGTFGFSKYILLFHNLSETIFNVVGSFCLFSSLFFLLNMFRSMDGKLLVASSSIVHMSSIIPSLTFFSSYGLISSVFMMVGHGYISYFLFMMISVLYEGGNSRSMDFNKNLESLNKTFMMVFFLVLFLNLGVPPFLSFLSELFFCAFYFKVSYFFFSLFCFSMVTSILYVMFFIYNFMYFKKNYVVSLFLDSKNLCWIFFPLMSFVYFPMLFF